MNQLVKVKEQFQKRQYNALKQVCIVFFSALIIAIIAFILAYTVCDTW